VFWLGLLVMFIAFSTIFVAIKQHRDETLGGVISFWAALLLGLGISTIASLVYVAIWECYLAVTNYQFIADYAEQSQDAAQAKRFTEQYSQPLFRMMVSFVEVFPPGLMVSLVSAALLRNHATAGKRRHPVKGQS
jgi:hypothetical protein